MPVPLLVSPQGTSWSWPAQHSTELSWSSPSPIPPPPHHTYAPIIYRKHPQTGMGQSAVPASSSLISSSPRPVEKMEMGTACPKQMENTGSTSETQRPLGAVSECTGPSPEIPWPPPDSCALLSSDVPRTPMVSHSVVLSCQWTHCYFVKCSLLAKWLPSSAGSAIL